MPITCQSPEGHDVFPDEADWPWWRVMIVRLIEWLEGTFLPPVPGFECMDCEQYGHGWMVTNEVWEEICKDEGWSPDNPYAIYCCECAEKRLGRKLTIKDFTDVPINQALHFGYKLGRRERKP